MIGVALVVAGEVSEAVGASGVGGSEEGGAGEAKSFRELLLSLAGLYLLLVSLARRFIGNIFSSI